jgi:PAS domain S-box-containing protein
MIITTVGAGDLNSSDVSKLATGHDRADPDTPPDTAFDDAALIALQACQAPMAAVSLFAEDRHWVLARPGFDAYEISPEPFCSYASRQQGVVTIRDLREDPEFKADPFAAGKPEPRFYAGIALQDEGNVPIGALCVLDCQPRPEGLTDLQSRTLQALARSLTREMRLRGTERELARETRVMGCDGKPDAPLTLSHDIAETSKAQQHLQPSEGSRDLAIKAAALGIWDLDTITGESRWSAEARELFGFAPDTAITREMILGRIHPDDRDRIASDLHNAECGSSPTFNHTFRVIRADTGDERWINGIGHIVVGPDGHPVRLLGIAQDVTHQVEAERTLRADYESLLRQSDHLQSILETVPDAIIVANERGIITSVSSTAVRMFGYQPEELTGASIKLLMPLPYREHHDRFMNRYRETGERRITESGRVLVALRKDGSTFPMEAHLGEMRSGGERFFTAFIRDLTDSQQTEKRMQELQSELSYISRLSAMGEMGSTLAHEVNQPLTAITGYLKGCEMILDRMEGEHVPVLRHGIEGAAEEALRAGDVIRQLRAFVARGETDQAIEDLQKLIEEASALALVGAKDKGIKVGIDLPQERLKVIVSRVQIQQVLLNLVRNAMEAMQEVEKRELLLKADLLENGEMAQVSVRDTGGGIAPAVLEKLFTPFTTTKKNGMGVGLSICRTIIEAHGGKIWADTTPGDGTTFHFTLKAITERDLAETGGYQER